jgi:hypothetical protein
MGLKEAIISLLNQLKTIQYTNGDGNAVDANVMLWNNQIERKIQGNGYTYSTPALFLEVVPSQGGMIGNGTTAYDLTFNVHIESELYNVEDELDKNIIVLDLRAKVLRAMNNFKPDACSPLFLSNETPDYNHTNTTHYILSFASHIVENTASIDDSVDYLIDTITNPIILFNEGVQNEEEITPPFIDPE